MTDLSCTVSNGSPSWGWVDLFVWKFLPESAGGGIPYIQRFKDAWVRHNKSLIQSNAAKYGMPAELLARSLLDRGRR